MGIACFAVSATYVIQQQQYNDESYGSANEQWHNDQEQKRQDKVTLSINYHICIALSLYNSHDGSG